MREFINTVVPIPVEIMRTGIVPWHVPAPRPLPGAPPASEPPVSAPAPEPGPPPEPEVQSPDPEDDDGSWAEALYDARPQTAVPPPPAPDPEPPAIVVRRPGHSPRIQRRLDVVLPDIARQLAIHEEAAGRQPLGEAPLRALARPLLVARQILSREPGGLAPSLYYRDGATAADAVALLRLVHHRLVAFARRYGYRARW